MSLLGNFSSGTKNRVYLSVTPGIGLEMIQLDVDNKTVINYAVRELAYNERLKDIESYEDFKNAVSDMFSELQMDPKVDVVINMPLVLFGQMKDLALLLPNDAITGAIQSEIEANSYLFSRVEPVVSWLDAPSVSGVSVGKESRTVNYAAIQQTVIDKLRSALAEVGCTLIGVENSLSSTFRALDYLGVTYEQMQPNITWNLVMINSMGYSLASMSGKNLIEYYEEPLPINSYEGDEIYDAIADSLRIILTSYPANYLYIVSDTDKVSAELVAGRVSVTSSKDFLENNAFKKDDSIMPISLNVLPNYASKISLQAIGCALTHNSNFPLVFNFMEGQVMPEDTCIIPIGEHQIVVTKNGALMAVLAIALVVIGLTYGLAFMFNNLANSRNQQVEEINSKIGETSAMLPNEGEVNAEFNLTTEVENGVKANRSKLMNYVAAGEAIPSNVWLTYFMTQGNGMVYIKGESTDVNSVYVFFKNMRDSLIGANLKLQKLEMTSQSVDAAVSGVGSNYKFEITNMSESQIGALQTPSGEGGEGQEGEEGSNPPEAELLSDQPVE